MSNIIPFLRSVLFALAFYPGSAIAVLLAFPLALLGRKAVRRQAVRWAAFHRWCARLFLGVESRVEGTIPRGPLIFASKHQSMYETLELLLMLHDPAVVVRQVGVLVDREQALCRCGRAHGEPYLRPRDGTMAG